MVEVKGDWTTELYKIASLQKTLMIMGPFRTSSSLIMNSDYDKKTIICTGIGITPFLSVINTKIDEYHTNDNYRSDFTGVFERDIEQHRAYNIVSMSGKETHILNTYKTSTLDIHWTFRDLDKVKNFFNYVRHVLLRSKNINNQNTEIQIGVRILNRMRTLGIPKGRRFS
jgi:predicted ferric reductase